MTEMKQTEHILFERLKKLGEKKHSWTDKIIDIKAKEIINEITKTEFYEESPYFSKQLMTKYNFLNLADELVKKESKR